MKSKIPKGLDVLNISIPDVLYLLHQIEAMQFLGFHSIHKKKYASQKNMWDDFYSKNSEINADFFELKKKIQNETQSFIDNYKPSDKMFEELLHSEFTWALSKKLTAKDSIYFTQEKLTPASFKTRYPSCMPLVQSITLGSLVKHYIGLKMEYFLLTIILQSEFWAGHYVGTVGANSIDILAENARNAARVSHAKHYKLRDAIQSWWLENRTHYKTQEKAAIAASELFGCTIDTAKKHIRAKAKEFREMRELPKK